VKYAAFQYNTLLTNLYCNKTLLTELNYEPQSLEERRVRARIAPEYTVIDGVLYRKPDSNSPASPPRKVILEEETFDVITKAHLDTMHAGRTKTFHDINERFYGITRQEVEFLLKHCSTCARNKSKSTRAPLQPIPVHSLFERVQVDLMDFRNQPDGEYKWILHIVDHFSKYSWTFPLRTKSAEEVASHLATWIGFFGPPRLLHSDNGTEFKGSLLLLAKQYGIQILHGRPRHPQSQGLVEKANGTFKMKLRAWCQDSGSTEWSKALPEIALSMNRQRHSTTATSPYQVVFKQRMRLNRLSFEDRLNAEVQEEIVSDHEVETDSNPVDPLLLQDNSVGDMEVEQLEPTPPDTNTSIRNLEAETSESDSFQSYASARSMDTLYGDEDFGLEKEHRDMLTRVRTNTSKFRQKMKDKYNTTHNVDVFEVGDMVSLVIPIVW
jgi:hypothetical protein